MKAAKAEGKNWRKELQTLLRNYRTTPHATTDITPAILPLKTVVVKKKVKLKMAKETPLLLVNAI